MRSLGVPIYLLGQSPDEEKLDKALSGGSADVHPLAEMAEQEIEEALFDDENPPPKPISPPKPKKKTKKKK